MERWHVKIIALFGTFVLPFFCTILPYKVSNYITKRGASGKAILSYLMCFGGGIFFGTYLLHMGPEVHKLMEESLDSILNPNHTEIYLSGEVPRRIDYPLPDLFIGFGFFLVLFSEKLVLFLNKRRIQKKKKCLVEQSSTVETVAENRTRRHSSVCQDVVENEKCKECTVGLPCSGTDEQELQLLTNDRSVVKLRPVVDIEDLDLSATTLLGGGEGSCKKAKGSCPFTGTGECCVDPVTPTKSMNTSEKHIIVALKVDTMHGSDCHSETTSVGGGGGHHHHATRSIILILALSLHRIFEGMSIGLQHSTQNVSHLFLAVMCHETVIGFSLGLQFVKTKLTLRRLMLTSFLCSIIMPIGVAIGTVMTEVGSDTKYVDVANGILQAIAMGTFIYVTFFEILQEEIDPEDTSLLKILFIFAGFIMMALLDLIPEEDTRPDQYGGCYRLPLLTKINITNV